MLDSQPSSYPLLCSAPQHMMQNFLLLCLVSMCIRAPDCHNETTNILFKNRTLSMLTFFSMCLTFLTLKPHQSCSQFVGICSIVSLVISVPLTENCSGIMTPWVSLSKRITSYHLKKNGTSKCINNY